MDELPVEVIHLLGQQYPGLHCQHCGWVDMATITPVNVNLGLVNWQHSVKHITYTVHILIILINPSP